MELARTATPLRIAQVAPLWFSIPPVGRHGGIEVSVHLITEELVKRGHEVTLFAAGGSRTRGKLRVVCESGMVETMEKEAAYNYDYYVHASIADVIRDAASFDLIHCHLGWSMIPFALLSKTPILYTMRSAVTVDDVWMVTRYPDVAVNAISQRQIAAIPEQRRKHIPVIYNGSNFDTYETSTEPGQYLAFLGRVTREKNPLDAILAAQRAGLAIVLAGAPHSSDDKRYFSEQIEPLIDGDKVRFIGPVDHREKNVFLKNASALLFPILWDEPFGNVMIEAMACGTPVVAYNRGSVSEVVDVGITGYYADSLESLAQMIPRALALDRKAIRERAVQRFNHERMVSDYMDLYQSLIEGGCRS